MQIIKTFQTTMDQPPPRWMIIHYFFKKKLAQHFPPAGRKALRNAFSLVNCSIPWEE